jgi:glutamyl-tRNA synthetase
MESSLRDEAEPGQARSLGSGTLAPMPGRFAPSPTGALHVGNLRTALTAWLLARSTGDAFRLRMEDLDRVTSSPAHERGQRRDLEALGIDWDGDVWRQSERFAVYEDALAELDRHGRTYECFCSRREIREAAAAPHGDEGPVYSGRCRRLSERERADRRRQRAPAVRFRADPDPLAVDDMVAGRVEGVPWDVVLRRNDGVPAYNLAVVVDDAAAGIDVVVRGDDLLPATASQLAIAGALGLGAPTYAHVPLVVGTDGRRLAKRDGAITLAELAAEGIDVAAVRAALAASLGLTGADRSTSAAELSGRFGRDELVAAGRQPIPIAHLLADARRAAAT